VGRVSSPRPQYQQQRDWVPDVRERLEMFGLAVLLIVGAGQGVLTEIIGGTIISLMRRDIED